jgi:hydrogenase expression/formation protein HypE
VSKEHAAAGSYVTLAHGGGGRLTQQLVEEHFLPRFSNPTLERSGADPLRAMLDSALLEAHGPLAFTTDGFVVRPIFFPGGDIGRLAVCGAVNDLASVGAEPLWLAASFILEEGMPFDQLDRVLDSMAATAREAGIVLVAGDTKVVERGAGDHIYIVTSAIGQLRLDPPPQPSLIRSGDAILVSGFLGDHGIAVLQAREHFFDEVPVASDCAPLWPLVQALAEAGVTPHALRDPTRGGLATVVAELSAARGLAFLLDEDTIPVRGPVQAACEMLGLDPLYLANEGKLVVVLPEVQAKRALETLRSYPLGRDACRVGIVLEDTNGLALLRSRIGGTRILESLSGEQLPRIC